MICLDSVQDPPKPAIRIGSRHSPRGTQLEPTDHGNGIVDIPFDLISECIVRYERILNPSIAFKYQLITRLPLKYNLVPSWIRSRFLRMQEIDSDLSRHLANEEARKSLAKAFEMLGFPLKRKDPPSLLLTHDIDTERGLARAGSLWSVENRLDMTSTWFLPSDEYPIHRDVLQELGKDSRIGSHDIKHDGKLIHIKRHESLVDRLRDSKLKLERIFEKKVECFRSPLLQFSQRIATGLREAGYHYDFSVPCWEPVHPITMGGFGIESAQGFQVDGVIELPLTLFQDHQVLNVLGISTREAVKFWIKQAELIRSFDGDIVLCVHPDYEFSHDLRMYKELLISLLRVKDLQYENQSNILARGLSDD
jgi:peptidoglycan/xylan/chitin deacetylase (PgdA/CDA1 family)